MNMSVWDQLYPDDPHKAAALKARAELMIQVQREIKNWGISQEQAAQKLGIHRPRVSDLMNDKFEKFNFETLYMLASRAGLVTVIETHRVTENVGGTARGPKSGGTKGIARSPKGRLKAAKHTVKPARKRPNAVAA